MTYQLSIILPCFNEVGNIAGLISDIRRCGWTEDEAEIVVVNDGSTDGTSELLARLEKIDRSLVVIKPDTRRGLGLSIYDGIKASKSQMVAVMDTDGIHDPSHLSQMFATAISTNSMIMISQ